MLGARLVVVADAHLGAASSADDAAFLDFLDQVPALGDCLLVNGDLFDFWFTYRRVVPRRAVSVAGALAGLARRLPVVMTGGNHDRWGDSFWDEDAGIRFSPAELRFEAAGRRIVAVHGDGIAETHRSASLVHRLTRHRLTAATYRLLHPDFGIWLVDKMSRHLADATRDPAVLDQAQIRQEAWARGRMAETPEVDLLIMAHTHRPAHIALGPGRDYLNPGAWVKDRRYAIVTPSLVELRTFGSSMAA